MDSPLGMYVLTSEIHRDGGGGGQGEHSNRNQCVATWLTLWVPS